LIVAFSAILSAALWKFRAHVDTEDRLALLMIITLTFSSYVHDYDYVALVPAFASLWWYARTTRHWAVIGGILFIMLIFPQRVVRIFDVPMLDQWRTILVAIMGAVILKCSRKPVPGGGFSTVPASTP